MNHEGFANLKSRLLWGIFSVTVVLAAIAGLQLPLFYPIFCLMLACVGALGLWEYYQLAVAKGERPLVYTGMSALGAYIFGTYLHLTFDLPWLPSGILTASIATFFLIHFSQLTAPLLNIAVTTFGLLYLAFPLSSVVHLAIDPPRAAHLGAFWVLYLIAVTKMGDTAAYFIGRSVGRMPLAPRLSPKKTIEGTLGAAVGSTLASLGLAWISGGALGSIEALVLGVSVGIAGQVGDLAESLLKRDAGIKDSNNIPGLGGVLDLLDSLLFTAPILFFYLQTG